MVKAAVIIKLYRAGSFENFNAYWLWLSSRQNHHSHRHNKKQKTTSTTTTTPAATTTAVANTTTITARTIITDHTISSPMLSQGWGRRSCTELPLTPCENSAGEDSNEQQATDISRIFTLFSEWLSGDRFEDVSFSCFCPSIDSVPVVVKSHDSHAVAPADGRYRMTNLWSGTWFQPQMGETKCQVTPTILWFGLINSA